jgi:hypothetical protein
MIDQPGPVPAPGVASVTSTIAISSIPVSLSHRAAGEAL